MRIFLYILAGICSASLGWNVGHILLSDIFSGVDFLYTHPEIILFPCMAIMLAIGMVLNEILISNPTRLSLARRKALASVPIAFGYGLVIGLGAGLLFQLLISFSLPTPLARMLGWLVIGLAVGFAEGVSWKSRSVEAGDPKRYYQRLFVSVIGALIASLVAALIFEFVRSNIQELPKHFKDWEDFLGFCILGAILGISFTITSSPSYMAALRAGAGFEFMGEELAEENTNFATIRTSHLKFVSLSNEEDDEESEIEEGLSIQLPGKGKIIIGSPDNPMAHICLPGVELNMGYISINGQKSHFKPTLKGYKYIKINGEKITSAKHSIPLKHNTIFSLATSSPSLLESATSSSDASSRTTQEIGYENNEETDIQYPEFYRFVYYNRFLDPQA